MLNRAVAGIRKRSLIVNLPGNPRAVDECLNFVLPQLQHGIEILRARMTNENFVADYVRVSRRRLARSQNFAMFFAAFLTTNFVKGTSFRMIPYIFNNPFHSLPVTGFTATIAAYGAFLIPKI